MTWNCGYCKHSNVWWRDICSHCGEPLTGFADQKPRESDEMRQMREVFEAVKKRYTPPLVAPLPSIRIDRSDCNCPYDGYICMNTACPRALRVSS